MTTFKILPYASYSASAKALAEALGCKRLHVDPDRSRFKPRQSVTVINWGNVPQAHRCTLNGSVDAMKRAANKLAFFQHHEGEDYLPQFWTNVEDIPDDAFPVVCRTTLTGHSGAGIVLSGNPDSLVDAPLYVKYVPKKDEYRIHLGLNSDTPIIIAIRQKKRRLNHADPNWKIRNYANGFTYAREGVNPPAGVLGVATDCLLRSGLDFGAFDVIWNEATQRAYVLEVNTAPGLEGQTLTDYANYFRSLV